MAKKFQHPLIIRLTHWTNAIALTIMVMSGLKIYNASPVFDIDFDFPKWATMGSWLGGALQWHFFAMWILGINGMIWILYNVFSKHGRYTTIFRPRDFGGLIPMIQYYLRIRKEHPPTKKYNALQKAAYTGIAFVGIGAILTGISIYWPVQFGWLTRLFGNYDTARLWHFIFMAAFVFFLLGHLFMVALAGWNNFVSMITGYKKEETV